MKVGVAVTAAVAAGAVVLGAAVVDGPLVVVVVGSGTYAATERARPDATSEVDPGGGEPGKSALGIQWTRSPDA